MIQPSEVFEFEVVRESSEAGGLRAEADWLVPADCPYLDGHFPGQPVLPAVAMIDGSLELYRLSCGPSGTRPPEGKLSLRKAKFTGVVVPGMKVSVCLLHKENRFDVDWKSAAGETLASFSFRI